MRKILLFLGMFLMFNINVLASHLDLIKIDGVYSSQLNMDTGDYFSSNQKMYIMDGKVAYCIEPGMNIMTREYGFSSNLLDSGLSQNIVDKIRLIGNFGYDYPGHQTDNYFLATQELIWEIIGNNEIHFTTGINDTGDMINIDTEKNEIMSLVNHYYLKPSFDSTLVTGLYQDEIVLVDKNKVLSNYEVVSTNNDVLIDGNNLIIKLSSLGDDKITLIRKNYDDLSSAFYYASNSQDFMFLRSDDVVTSVINVRSYIPYSNISIDKVGSMLEDFDGEFIYKNRGLDDVVFLLYAANDIYEGDKLLYHSNDLVERLITKNGQVVSQNLPNGVYYLKEFSTLDDFLLSDDVIFVELDNYKEEIYTYSLEFENDRKSIFLNLEKKGEVIDEIVDGSGSYTETSLGGVEFGLFSANDIFSVDGKLLIHKDELITTLVTDSRGFINENLNIPFGDYYLKELSTVLGYKLDTNTYQFSVFSDSNENIQISIGSIVNELIKGNLVINKVDFYGNSLSGACFRLFDKLGNVMYEGCTGSDGVISINNLGYGEYYFYEVSAPDGYLVSDKIYEVSVVDEELIEVNVVNEKLPITSDIYAVPKKISVFGIGFGLITLCLTIIYDKKYKNN